MYQPMIKVRFAFRTRACLDDPGPGIPHIVTNDIEGWGHTYYYRKYLYVERKYEGA